MIPDKTQPPVFAHSGATREAAHSREDCGEPATRETADGVWLCEGDFDALLDAAFWNLEQEIHA